MWVTGLILVKEMALTLLFLTPAGLILRRCTLDAVGLAFWENPTHIKCVSKEFQDIQTLVSTINQTLVLSVNTGLKV